MPPAKKPLTKYGTQLEQLARLDRACRDAASLANTHAHNAKAALVVVRQDQANNAPSTVTAMVEKHAEAAMQYLLESEGNQAEAETVIQQVEDLAAAFEAVEIQARIGASVNYARSSARKAATACFLATRPQFASVKP